MHSCINTQHTYKPLKPKAVSQYTCVPVNYIHIKPLMVAADLGTVPYVIVGAEAFPLQIHLAHPFPWRNTSLSQQAFNYRHVLSTLHCGKAFWMAARIWKVFHTKMEVSPDLAVDIVKTVCVLHNFLQAQSTPTEMTSLLNDMPDISVEGLQDIQGKGNRSGQQAGCERSLHDLSSAQCGWCPGKGNMQRGMFRVSQKWLVTPVLLTQRSWSGLTLLSRHSVGTYQGNELTHNSLGNTCPVLYPHDLRLLTCNL